MREYIEEQMRDLLQVCEEEGLLVLPASQDARGRYLNLAAQLAARAIGVHQLQGASQR